MAILTISLKGSAFGIKMKKKFGTSVKNMTDSDDLNDVASDIIMCNYEDCLTINITREWPAGN